MILKKWMNKREDGFVLLESLVSLGIITIVVVSTLPFFIDLLSFWQEEKGSVEFNRVLYDFSKTWDGNVKQEYWESGNQIFTILNDKDGILITEESGSEKNLEINTIEFHFVSKE